jgi:hypothetical protein
VDLLDILRVVRRRWKVAAVAAIAGFGLLILASSAVEPDWDGTAIVAVDPPSANVFVNSIGEIEVVPVNPITGGDAAAAFVPRLAVVTTSQETRTTFFRAGLSTAYEVAYIQRQPYMTLTVTDGDPDLVVATLDAVIDFLQLEVTAEQDASNIADDARAKITVLAETEIAANQTTERRAQGVIFVLTIVAAVTAAMLTDIYFRRRDEAAYAARFGPESSTIDDRPAVVETAGGDEADVTSIDKPNRWQRGSGSA